MAGVSTLGVTGVNQGISWEDSDGAFVECSSSKLQACSPHVIAVSQEPLLVACDCVFFAILLSSIHGNFPVLLLLLLLLPLPPPLFFLKDLFI